MCPLTRPLLLSCNPLPTRLQACCPLNPAIQQGCRSVWAGPELDSPTVPDTEHPSTSSYVHPTTSDRAPGMGRSHKEAKPGVSQVVGESPQGMLGDPMQEGTSKCSELGHMDEACRYTCVRCLCMCVPACVCAL